MAKKEFDEFEDEEDTDDEEEEEDDEYASYLRKKNEKQLVKEKKVSGSVGNVTPAITKPYMQESKSLSLTNQEEVERKVKVVRGTFSLFNQQEVTGYYNEETKEFLGDREAVLWIINKLLEIENSIGRI